MNNKQTENTLRKQTRGFAALTTTATAEDWASAAGMDWHVYEAAITYHPSGLNAEPAMAYGGMKVLYRSDNCAPLSIVPASFLAPQPIDTFAYYKRFAEFYELRPRAAGELKGGKLWWCMLDANLPATAIDESTLNSMLLLSTECDAAFPATLVATCMVSTSETLLPGFYLETPPVRIPLSAEFLPPSSLTEIGNAIGQCAMLTNFLATLTTVRVNESVALQYYRTLLQLHDESRKTRNANKQLNELLEKRAQTAWALLSTFAQHVDARSRRSGDDGLYFRWFGAGFEAKREALRLCVEMFG